MAPEFGEAADPSVIPGAFTDESLPWITFTPQVTSGSISFSSTDGTWNKIYKLLENGIEVSYQGAATITTRIPLALDPYSFDFSHSIYFGTLTPGTWTWGLASGIQVVVVSDAIQSIRNFTDSFPFLSWPEDPDLAYPVGHFLPFPFSVVDLKGSGVTTVMISVK